MDSEPDGKGPDSASPGGDGESARITTIEDLAARQQATDSRLDGLAGKIDQLLGGSRAAREPDPGAAGAPSSPGGATGLDAIRQAIRDVHAEDKTAADQAAHAAEHDRLRAARDAAERQPREAMATWKGKLQKTMFGADKP